MPYDIGRRLAHHPAQHRLCFAVEGSNVLLDVDFDSRRLQSHSGRGQLGGKRGLAVTRHRLAHLPHRVTAQGHNVPNLGGIVEALGKKARRQLTFQRDERKTVTEQVVQVSGDRSPAAAAPACCRPWRYRRRKPALASRLDKGGFRGRRLDRSGCPRGRTGHERRRSLVGIPRHGEGANPEGVAVPRVEPRRADAPEARSQELAATAKDSVDRVLAELGDLEDGGVFHGASVAPSGWSTNRGKYVKLRAQPSGHEALPSSAIHAATWARELKPSLVMMFVRWVSTVRSDRNSLSAIARLVIPAATSRAISTSRRLKPRAGLCGVPDRERKCSRTSA